MFLSGKTVLKAVAIVILAGLPFSAATAKMAAVRSLLVESLAADAILVHKVGMRPISGAYYPSRPAGAGTIGGQYGHGYGHGFSNRNRGRGWFAGRSWFGHHSWFNGRPHRQTSTPLGPTASQTAIAPAAPVPAAALGKPSQRGEISATPRAGITSQDKAYRALIRATYPVALKLKPRIRHVNRQPRFNSHVATGSYVRWSSKTGRRNTAMVPYVRRY